jgi:hypothetical protein
MSPNANAFLRVSFDVGTVDGSTVLLVPGVIVIAATAMIAALTAHTTSFRSEKHSFLTGFLMRQISSFSQFPVMICFKKLNRIAVPEHSD